MGRVADYFQRYTVTLSRVWLPSAGYLLLFALGLWVLALTGASSWESWRILIGTFWTTPAGIAQGFLALAAGLGIAWVFAPLTAGYLTAPTVRDSTPVRRRHLRYVIACSGVAVGAVIVTFPLAAPVVASSGLLRYATRGLALLSPGALIMGALRSAVMRRRNAVAQGSAEPPLTAVFDPAVRPRSGWQLNLDIGSLAPRIGAVVDGLANWSEFFEASAPTSRTIWTFVRGKTGNGRDAVPEWQLEYIRKHVRPRLRKSAWAGADNLRETLATYLKVHANQIIFLGGTTRALEVALAATAYSAHGQAAEKGAPEVIFTTEYEHDTEYGRFEALRYFHGTEITVIEIGDILDSADNRAQAARDVAIALVERVRQDPRPLKSLVVSHVTHSGGIVFPMRELVREWEAQERPGRLIVDGAHAVGQIDVSGLDKCDAYVFSGHKWLLGPASLLIVA